MHILYIIALLLLIGWAVGVVGYAFGGVIHLLLLFALIAILLRMFQRKRPA